MASMPQIQAMECVKRADRYISCITHKENPVQELWDLSYSWRVVLDSCSQDSVKLTRQCVCMNCVCKVSQESVENVQVS